MDEIKAKCSSQQISAEPKKHDQNENNYIATNINETNESKKINTTNTSEISDAIMEKTFKLLYQQIIQNAENLIIDHQASLLEKNYCYKSDIVTIMKSINALIQNPEYEDKSGFSIEVLNSIFKNIEENCEYNGRTLIISAFKRLESQNKSILKLIDSFIKNDFLQNIGALKECQGTFNRIIGVNNKNNPTLIYLINGENEKDCKKIKFSKRPGICKLENPRNVLVLKKYHDEADYFDHGILLHRDYNFDESDLGVAKYSIIGHTFNYLFFNYLFEAYWNDRSLENDFTEIYRSHSTQKSISTLFYITSDGFLSTIYFCPQNKYIKNLAFKGIEVCINLLPFFPNSIIIQNNDPLCAIDFIGDIPNGSYKTKIYIINDDDEYDRPIPYSLNKATLEFALLYSHKLDKENPMLWFSITGENFLYKKCNGHETEAKFSNPDTGSNIKSVFDPNHPSHLVFFIDKNFPYRPKNVEPLLWLPNSEITTNIKETFDISLNTNEKTKENAEKNINEEYCTKLNQNIINISSKIINEVVNVEKSSDLFFVTLSGGYPVVSPDSIPDSICGLVEFSPTEGNSVKNGIYHLIKQFSKKFVINHELTESIQLKEITSTDHWKYYPMQKEARENTLNEICLAIKNHFNIDEKNIEASFLGRSMILLKINGLKENLVHHQMIEDVWNNDYQRCKADIEIMNILNKCQNINFQVSEVIHEPSIKVKVVHKKSFEISEKEFINRVDKVTKRFGFFKLSKSDYIENQDIQQNDINGFINIELLGTLVGISFASTIKKEFSQNININNALQDEIDAMRQQFVMNYSDHSKRNKTNILIIPSSNDALKKDIVNSVSDINKYSTCIDLCDEPKIYLPQCLSTYCNCFKLPFAICRNCILEIFNGMSDLQNVINPQTHMIDRTKMTDTYEFLPYFLFINDEHQYSENSKSVFPLGQTIWTLNLGDELISHYIKMWFMYNISVQIRISTRHFICCPFHKDVFYRTPKNGEDLICPKCGLFYHSKCHDWHLKKDKCYVLPEGHKRCPYCFMITEKTSGCSHVICQCKKHWCFQCENSPYFDSSNLCYYHMMMEHNEKYFEFDHVIFHIYLNNEKEIIKFEKETATFNVFIQNDEVLVIHDRQNGDKLQICSYDQNNLMNNFIFGLPTLIEKIYDYDSILFINNTESAMEKDSLIKSFCQYFNYSIHK